jgi:hypothetical protein
MQETDLQETGIEGTKKCGNWYRNQSAGIEIKTTDIHEHLHSTHVQYMWKVRCNRVNVDMTR